MFNFLRRHAIFPLMPDQAPRSVLGCAVHLAPRVLAALFLALATLSFGSSALAKQNEAAGTKPVTPVGAYITSLHDFDTVNDSFGVDYWVWSVHSPE